MAGSLGEGDGNVLMVAYFTSTVPAPFFFTTTYTFLLKERRNKGLFGIASISPKIASEAALLVKQLF